MALCVSHQGGFQGLIAQFLYQHSREGHYLYPVSYTHLDVYKRQPYTYLFANIKGYNEGTLNISAPDAKTFVVQLYYPDISFLQLTTYPIFAPVKDTIQDFSNGGIGNGAFKIKLIDDNMIVIEKNNYYQDLNNVHINEISFILSSDIEQADSLYPVSYTHLDVHKRQEILWGLWALNLLKTTFRK